MEGPRFADPCPNHLPPELRLSFPFGTLRGTSIASRATALAVQELGFALDLGRLTPVIMQQPTVFLTHAHLDHSSALAAYLNTRARFFREEKTTVWVPEPLPQDFLAAFAVLPGMHSVRKRIALEEVLRPAWDGTEVGLPWGHARAFATDHGVPSLGWAFYHRGSSRPFLVFAGDGDPWYFASRPQLLDAQVAVVECSLSGENRRLAARLARHAHILDWIELAPRLCCEVLVLAHLPEEGLNTPTLLRRLQATFAGQLAVFSLPSPRSALEDEVFAR
ncbi:MAG: MBL fold metallo-hydrolase [Thermoanaerobaculum sp.]